MRGGGVTGPLSAAIWGPLRRCGATVLIAVALSAMTGSAAADPAAPQRAVDRADRILAHWMRKGDASQQAHWTEVKEALTSGDVSDGLLRRAKTAMIVNAPVTDEETGEVEQGRFYKAHKKTFKALERLHRLSAAPSWLGNDPWGIWDDLPFDTQRSIHGIRSPDSLVVTQGKTDSSLYMAESSGGAGKITEDDQYGHSTATWTGRVHGVIIQPRELTLSNPRITFNYRFSDGRANAGISYKVSGAGDARRATLDTWQDLDLSTAEFSSASGDLTGKFYDRKVTGLQFFSEPNHHIVGRVKRPTIVGVFKASR